QSAGGKEHQRHIGERERAENDGGFQIHPRAVGLAMTRAFELGVYPSSQFVVKRVVAAEFKRLVMDARQFGDLASARWCIEEHGNAWRTVKVDPTLSCCGHP